MKYLHQNSFLKGGVSRSQFWRAVFCVFISSVLIKFVESHTGTIGDISSQEAESKRCGARLASFTASFLLELPKCHMKTILPKPVSLIVQGYPLHSLY